MRLTDRKAVITGGAQGIGRAIAERYAREGADIAILDINADAAAAAASEIAAATGRTAVAVKVDVTSEESVAEAMKTAADRLSGLDLLVNNAGVLKSHYIADFPKREWDFVLGVNLTGAFLCIKHATPYIVQASRPGSMVVIASRSGKRGGLWNHAYCASKFGVIGLVQCVALDLAPKKVRINCICPGNALDTPLWVDLAKQYAVKYNETEEQVLERYRKRVPLGRGCDVEDIANLATFLASDESSYMTGQAVNLTGGEIMSP
ncbi:MAG: SDR family oxidoreductase [Planctomycetes bacterium]|nr:SDR family oxidoreductase [Planctomycetota bacterium]MCC8115861.1 SDR family oxidoreductase [Planctomycetota bacterium]MCD7898023.1 SDR family oxidoreductase [Planctomycetaceae bacterium]